MRSHLAMILVGAMLTFGCGAHSGPNTTPQSKVAFYGSDVLEASLAVQKTVIDLNASGAMTTEQARPILDGIDQRVRMNAEKLSTALKAYDAASTAGDRSDARAAVFTALTAVEKGLDSVFPKSGTFVSQIRDTVQKVFDLLMQLRGAIALP